MNPVCRELYIRLFAGCTPIRSVISAPGVFWFWYSQTNTVLPATGSSIFFLEHYALRSRNEIPPNR